MSDLGTMAVKSRGCSLKPGPKERDVVSDPREG